MQLKTILNRGQKFKSFVYTKVSWGSTGAAYGRLTVRRFEFVPLWDIICFDVG